MRAETFSATACAIFFVAVPSAIGQISLPREAQQILDAAKGARERPAAPGQTQPPPSQTQPAESPTSQPAPSRPPVAAAAASPALDNNEQYRDFKKWAVMTQYIDPYRVPNEYKFCTDAYEKMIASGVAPTTRVPDEKVTGKKHGDPDIHWTGTVQQIKENWCDAGLKKLTGDVATRHAPYRANLKGDKLGLVIDETHGHVRSYALPGGQYTDDAKKLAAASVWFLDLGAPSNERQYCPSGGKRKFVRRYSFDGQHKLLGTTQKEYCGDPPASAYR